VIGVSVGLLKKKKRRILGNLIRRAEEQEVKRGVDEGQNAWMEGDKLSR